MFVNVSVVSVAFDNVVDAVEFGVDVNVEVLGAVALSVNV